MVCNTYFSNFSWVVTITRDQNSRSSWTARGISEQEEMEVFVLKHRVQFPYPSEAREDFLDFARKHSIEQYVFNLI